MSWQLWPRGAADRLSAALDAATPGEDLIGIGLDLEVDTLLTAYRTGYFPMGIGRQGRRPMGWWSPDPRGVLTPGVYRPSRSLRKAAGRFEVTIDTAFDAVLEACADPDRTGRWITADIARAYQRLHEVGCAHSVEVWSAGELVGGLYGVNVGGLFAGESMFHRATDASKVAYWALTEMIFADEHPDRLLDVQWVTPHLASLGVRSMSRPDYRRALARAVDLPEPLFGRSLGTFRRDTRTHDGANARG